MVRRTASSTVKDFTSMMRLVIRYLIVDAGERGRAQSIISPLRSVSRLSKRSARFHYAPADRKQSRHRRISRFLAARDGYLGITVWITGGGGLGARPLPDVLQADAAQGSLTDVRGRERHRCAASTRRSHLRAMRHALLRARERRRHCHVEAPRRGEVRRSVFIVNTAIVDGHSAIAPHGSITRLDGSTVRSA